MFLGAGAAAGLGLGTSVGWTTAGIVGVVVAVAAGIGARVGLARPGASGRRPPRRAAPQGPRRSRELVEQKKDWIKNEFDGKIRELEKKRETMVHDAEETMARGFADFQARHQKQTEEADTKYPGRSSRSACVATRASKS